MFGGVGVADRLQELFVASDAPDVSGGQARSPATHRGYDLFFSLGSLRSRPSCPRSRGCTWRWAVARRGTERLALPDREERRRPSVPPRQEYQYEHSHQLRVPPDGEFMEMCTEKGCVGIKGHRSVGGFRASIYNAMPIESVQVLVDVMKSFAEKYS